MTLDDSRFATVTDQLLERIADIVDEVLGDEVDADLQGGILTLSLEGGGQYILNKNAPMKQLWLASPVSGAWHFEYAEGEWVSTRAPKVALAALLAQELNAKYGSAVCFDAPPLPPLVGKGGGRGG